MKPSLPNRILFWSERFWPTIGGVGLSAGKLLPVLRARGYDFVVVTLRDDFHLPEEDFYQGIPVYRFPFWTAVASRDTGQILQLCQRVRRLKKAFAPNLIHLNFVGPSTFIHFRTLDAHHAPLLVSTDSALVNQGAGHDSLAVRALRSADWVTCVSAERLAQAHTMVPEITSHSSIIYRGREVPRDVLTPLPYEVPRLLCLGRLDRMKGFDLALPAFARVIARFPKARLVIAGDGPARPELERQATALGLQDKVDFVGWVEPDKVPALINTVTLVVISSRSEGIPHVAMEAGLMARPVVASRVGGLPEIVVHGETGLLVEPENSSALFQAIVFLVEHPDESIRMGWAARIRVQQIFGWDRYVDAYDSLYQKLIEQDETR